MSTYPEHEKMAAVKDDSQTIGLFLDEGLSRLGLHLAQWVCSFEPYPVGGFGASRHPTHEEAEAQHLDHIERHHDGDGCIRARLVIDGRAIEAVLAAYFGIDLSAIEAEKRAMLASLRESAA